MEELLSKERWYKKLQQTNINTRSYGVFQAYEQPGIKFNIARQDDHQIKASI